MITEEVPLEPNEKSVLLLQFQVKELQKDVHKLANSFMASTGPVERRLDGLEKRVDGNLEKIDAKLTIVSDRLELRSRPNWSLIVSVIGLLVLIGPGINYYLTSNLRENDIRHEKNFELLKDTVVPRSEISVLVNKSRDSVEVINRRLDALEARRK